MVQKRKTFFAILIIIGFVIGLHILRVLTPIENIFSSILQWTSRPFNSFAAYLHTRKEVNTDIDQMIQEILSLKQSFKQNEVDAVALRLLKEENEELRKQLTFFSSHNFEHIGADVIGRTVDPLGTTIIINRGIQDGISKDNPVVVGNGILIGSILKVDKHSSIVRLINDNNSKIGATIMNNEKSIGLIEGGYGLGVRMNFIPQNEIISPGDTVITSGLTTGVPRGLIIGKVEVVEKHPYEPFQQAVINSTADLAHITAVSVITQVFIESE